MAKNKVTEEYGSLVFSDSDMRQRLPKPTYKELNRVMKENKPIDLDIANEVARLSVSWLPEIMESNKPNLIQDAIVPTEKSSPSYKKNVAIGVLAGAVLCYGFFVVRHLLDDTIKSADDMEKYFGVVPLTSIPEDPAANDGSRDSEQRAGMRATLRKFAKKFKKKKKSGKKGKH